MRTTEEGSIAVDVLQKFSYGTKISEVSKKKHSRAREI